jgi:hypothetical protein
VRKAKFRNTQGTAGFDVAMIPGEIKETLRTAHLKEQGRNSPPCSVPQGGGVNTG